MRKKALFSGILYIHTKRARRLSPSGSSFPVGLRFALFAEKREHGSGRDGCADDSRDVRPHRVHEDVGAREFLLDDLLADARRHRNRGDAGRADDGVDSAAGHALHDLSEDHAAGRTEYERYQAEQDDLDRGDRKERFRVHRAADGNAEEYRRSVEDFVLRGLREALSASALAEQVAEHQHA